MSKLSSREIKIYSDMYANSTYAFLGFRGKDMQAQGIIYCPYRKPNILVRIFRKIFERFEHTREAVPLCGDN